MLRAIGCLRSLLKLGVRFYPRQALEEGLATPQQMLFMWLCRGVNSSHLAPLPSCSPLVGDHSFPNWHFLGFPLGDQGFITQLEGLLCGKKRRKIWNSIPLWIFWIVWKERNRIAFRDGILAVQRLNHSFVSNLWS